MKKRFAIILGSFLVIAIIVSVCAISFGDGVSFLESLGIISKRTMTTPLLPNTMASR